MSAWFHYCNSLGSTVDMSKSVLMKKAFNAGLEAAALEAEKETNEYNDSSWNGACMEIAIAIRALKEETT